MHFRLLRTAGAFVAVVSLTTSAFASDPTFHGLWHTHPGVLSAADGTVRRVEAGRIAFDPSAEFLVLQGSKLSMLDDFAIQRRRYLVRSDVSDFVVVPSNAGAGLPPDALLVSTSSGLQFGTWSPVTASWTWTDVAGGAAFAGAQHLQTHTRPSGGLDVVALTTGGTRIQRGTWTAGSISSPAAVDVPSGVRDLVALDWNGSTSPYALEFAVLYASVLVVVDSGLNTLAATWAGGGRDMIERTPWTNGRDQLVLVAEDTITHSGQYLTVLNDTQWESPQLLGVPTVGDLRTTDFDGDGLHDLLMTCVAAREAWVYYGRTGASTSFATRSCPTQNVTVCTSHYRLSDLTTPLIPESLPIRRSCAIDADGDGDVDLMAVGDELEATLVEGMYGGPSYPSLGGSVFGVTSNGGNTTRFDVLVGYMAPNHPRLAAMNAVEVSIWAKPDLGSTVTHWGTVTTLVSNFSTPPVVPVESQSLPATAIFQIRARAVRQEATIDGATVIVDALPAVTSEWSASSSVMTQLYAQLTAYRRADFSIPNPGTWGSGSGVGGVQPRPNGP